MVRPPLTKEPGLLLEDTPVGYYSPLLQNRDRLDGRRPVPR
jgi:hypothetical protein